MHAADIETVLVDGKVVIENRKLTTADETEIMAKAVAWGKKVKEADKHT